MRRGVDGSFVWAALAVALLAGAALLGAVAWLRPLERGDEAARAGRLEEALSFYARAEARFDRLPVAKQLFPTAYAASQANQLRVLYGLGRHDALLEKSTLAVPHPGTHFWAGCALFARAMEEVEPEARIGWLSRASEEYRKALALAPADWDVKYDYELTERLLAQLRKDPAKPPKELLQLLRPKPTPGRAPAPRIG
jgi:hypothetical protein